MATTSDMRTGLILKIDGSLYTVIEFGQKDICLGVPVIIGKNGWEKIIDFKLNEQEQASFNKSADAVRGMNNVLGSLSV